MLMTQAHIDNVACQRCFEEPIQFDLIVSNNVLQQQNWLSK